MKDQYVGDIGDYGKYGLLRFMAAHGIRIGINWYLTENDRSNDGKKISYLNRPANARFDPVLFNALKELAFCQDKGVELVESKKLIPNAKYYSAILRSKGLSAKERYLYRQEWHRQAFATLAGADLVFCDPDNGPLGCKTVGSKQSEKYVSLVELTDYYNRGQNVLYYCHKARRTEVTWEKVKYEMLASAPDASVIVLTFHGGTQRSYIFAVHPSDRGKYRAIADAFLRSEWRELFSEE